MITTSELVVSQRKKQNITLGFIHLHCATAVYIEANTL